MFHKSLTLLCQYFVRTYYIAAAAKGHNFGLIRLYICERVIIKHCVVDSRFYGYMPFGCNLWCKTCYFLRLYYCENPTKSWATALASQTLFVYHF